MPENLFGHLAFRFTSSPENLATESLVFILNRSHYLGTGIERDAVAKRTLDKFIRCLHCFNHSLLIFPHFE